MRLESDLRKRKVCGVLLIVMFPPKTGQVLSNSLGVRPTKILTEIQLPNNYGNVKRKDQKSKRTTWWVSPIILACLLDISGYVWTEWAEDFKL